MAEQIGKQEENGNLYRGFNVYEASDGEWRWRLVSSNGRIIADSGEGYGDRGSVEDAIDSVIDTIKARLPSTAESAQGGTVA